MLDPAIRATRRAAYRWWLLWLAVAAVIAIAGALR